MKNIVEANKAIDFADEATMGIFAELNDRGGFDDWWENLDDDIQSEIRESIEGFLFKLACTLLI